MTVVRHKFLRPSPAGDVPYSLELRFRPSRARVLDGDPKAVVVPAEFSEDLPAGILNVDLAPTGPGWCWEIFRPYGKVESLREWVVVPEPVSDPDNPGEFLPVDYPDLVRVDPATLEPTAEPDPVWWAALEAAKATASDVEAARVAAAGSAVEAGAARDDAVVAAGAASGFAGDAAGSASAAVAAAGTARTDAATASTAAGDAGLALTGAESARDATVAAAGGSEASATLAAEAATGAKQDAADAKRDAGVIIEMTETGRLSETALSATIGELSGPVIDAKVAPAVEAASQSAQSAAGSEAAALDVVTRANAGEFDGKQGLPGNATMRIDNTVGNRVFISNGTTERMVSGDTGAREIKSTSTWNADTIVLHRIGDTVFLNCQWMPTAEGTAPEIPSGFRPRRGYAALPVLGSKSMRGYILLHQSGAMLPAVNESVSWSYTTISWATSDPWPTSLPGIPT